MKHDYRLLILAFLLIILQGCGQKQESALNVSEIYLQKAQHYINSGDYAAARTILEEGLKKTDSSEMKDLLDAVGVLQSVETVSSEPATEDKNNGIEEMIPTTPSEALPEPVEAPHGPSEADIQGVDERIVRPNQYAWLRDYEARYVHSSRGGGIYLRYAPSESADRISTLSDNTIVTVLAEQDGFSFVSAPGRAFGWCKASLLEHNPYASGISDGISGTYDSLDFLGIWDGGAYTLELTREDSYRDRYYDATITIYPEGDSNTRIKWTYFALYDPHREGFECYCGSKAISYYPFVDIESRYSSTGWAFISIVDPYSLVWSVTTGEAGDPENIVFRR